MLLLKAILIVLNTIFLIGAMVALIRYVRKTSEIAKFSEDTIQELKKTTIANRKAVDLSRNILSEMQETRKWLTAPLVIAYFERRKTHNASRLFFIIENVGKGVAVSLGYKFVPELIGKDDESVKRIIALGNKFSSLPPGYSTVNLFGRVSHYIDSEYRTLEELNTELPRQFEVLVSFTDAITGELYSNKYALDLSVPIGACLQ